MKIGIDLTSLPLEFGGGKEQFILNFIAGWQENGWERELTVIAFPDHEERLKKILKAAEIIIVPRRKMKFQAQYFRTFELRKIVYKEAIDLIFFPHPETGFRRMPVPTVVNPHDIQFIEFPERQGLYGRWKTKFLYYWDFFLRDRVVSISNYDHEAMVRHYPKHKNKIRRIYNPIIFDEGENIKSVLGRKKIILAVNIGFKHKNVDIIIKAFDRIYHKVPHKLVLVGKTREETKGLLKLVEKSRARDRIEMLGHIKADELDQLYEESEVFVTASSYEGFGMTVVEAMAKETPVVAARSTALPEVTFNDSYYYYPPNDEHALGDLLLKVLHKLPEQEELTKLREKALETYDYRIVAREYRDLFTECIENFTMDK